MNNFRFSCHFKKEITDMRLTKSCFENIAPVWEHLFLINLSLSCRFSE